MHLISASVDEKKIEIKDNQTKSGDNKIQTSEDMSSMTDHRLDTQTKSGNFFFLIIQPYSYFSSFDFMPNNHVFCLSSVYVFLIFPFLVSIMTNLGISNTWPNLGWQRSTWRKYIQIVSCFVFFWFCFFFFGGGLIVYWNSLSAQLFRISTCDICKYFCFEKNR